MKADLLLKPELVAKLLIDAIDPDYWAIVRLRELLDAGEKAQPRIEWKCRPDGGVIFDVSIRRADGTIERCPTTFTVTMSDAESR